MRKRVFNWQCQSFVCRGLEGPPGQPLEVQAKGLFERAAAELKTLGLSIDNNVVRTRVFGRSREARNVVSEVRGKTFIGQARAATSSFISPAHFDSQADVALDLYAMSLPGNGAREVTEHKPQQPFIRYLT